MIGRNEITVFNTNNEEYEDKEEDIAIEAGM